MTANVHRRRSPPLLVALVGFAITAVLVGKGLAAYEWDPTIFVGFGAEAPDTLDYAEERLGEVLVRAELGHDGKFFFVQANDPWVLDPEENAEALDLPVYRSQRMLYPVLAGGFGFLQPEAIVWALLVVNVIAMAAGTWAAAVVARRVGSSPWLGLAFAFNIGLIFSIVVDGASVVAAATAFWAVALLLDEKWIPALAMLTASALTREVMILVAVGVGWWLWRAGRRRMAMTSFLLPVAAVGFWRLYLILALGPDDVGPQAVGLPFVGLARAIPEWSNGGVFDLLVGSAVVLLLVLYARRAVLSPTLLGLAFIGFVPLAAIFTARVWSNYFDHTRAVSPVITAFILMMFARDGDTNDEEQSNDSQQERHGSTRIARLRS